MDFELPEELRMLRETVARFVREELLPLERAFTAGSPLAMASSVTLPKVSLSLGKKKMSAEA